MIAPGGISSEALYVYCYFAQWQNIERKEIRTHLSVLDLDIRLCKKDAVNKSKIKAAVDELVELGLIEAEFLKTVLVVRFAMDWEDRFTKVPIGCLEKLTPVDLHVIAFITKWAYTRSAISYDEWTRVLRVSNKTAVKVIKEMRDKGLIRVSSGKYYEVVDGCFRQEMNKYKVEESQTNAMYGESVARDLTRKNGYSLLGDSEKILGIDAYGDAKRMYYMDDGTVVSRDVTGYSVDQKKKLWEWIKGDRKVAK